jgi:hypothetical protein
MEPLLKKHKLSTPGYTCDICGKVFKHKQHLYRHKRQPIQQKDLIAIPVIHNSTGKIITSVI